MPAITDQPPRDTRQELTRLRRQLTRDVPRKGDQNLRWIQEFSDGSRDQRELLEGKGASVAEMTRVVLGGRSEPTG